jgi:hypothetical protein
MSSVSDNNSILKHFPTSVRTLLLRLECNLCWDIFNMLVVSIWTSAMAVLDILAALQVCHERISSAQSI